MSNLNMDIPAADSSPAASTQRADRIKAAQRLQFWRNLEVRRVFCQETNKSLENKWVEIRANVESNQVTEQQLDEAIRDKASTIKILRCVSDENALLMEKQDQLKRKIEEAYSKIPRPSVDSYRPVKY